jgi:hypothetical protein
MPLGVTLVIVGGAGLVVGAITGAMSLSETGTIKQSCSGVMCPATQAKAIDDARTLAIASDIGFIAGAALAVLGGAFIIVGRPHKAPRVGAYVMPNGVGLAGQF